jgi:hypothetical protein
MLSKDDRLFPKMIGSSQRQHGSFQRRPKDAKDPAVFPKKGTLTIKDVYCLWQNTSFSSLVSFQSSKDENFFAKL